MAKVQQAARFATAGAIGAGLLVLSGLTLTGTVIGLVAATPLLVIFSPILVPAAAVVAVVAAGLLLSGGFGVAAVSALTWIYNYVTGKHPPGADRLDEARAAIARKAKDYGRYVQTTTQEIAATGS
ncbi:oleosin Ara h 15.0101 [Elaeis guineensis]|uniref:Oleosin 1 n=1 Tax=Elaeis guineensis var. tenera TaxID=51953 RepID=A0A6I9QUH0_ELAGV|nr:oleosin 1 [Elaeis guineensis]